MIINVNIIKENLRKCKNCDFPMGLFGLTMYIYKTICLLKVNATSKLLKLLK